MKSPVIQIDLDDRGMGTVLIDGHNIANATYKTTIHTEAGRENRVVLELWGHNIRVTAPATVIAEIKEAYALEDRDVDRIVERVLEEVRKDMRRAL